jgi:hypothetical protein
MGHELGQGFALLADEPFQAREQLVIRQCGSGEQNVGDHAS